MFLRKIPYESVQRRRIRDWLLLALRLAAIALIVTAFARPFLRGTNLAAASGGARDIVVLLDRSYSMGYADSWSRAQRAAAQALDSATPADRISVVLFADTAEIVAAIDAGSIARRGRDQRRDARAGIDEVRPGVEARREPAGRIAPAAQGSDSGVGLPARRVAAGRYAAAAGRHHDHDGDRRGRAGREPRADAGGAAAIA